MTSVFRMPLDFVQTESMQITKVNFRAGNFISKDEILLEFETDKASYEFPCPFSCKIENMFVEPGMKISAGDKLFSYFQEENFPPQAELKERTEKKLPVNFTIKKAFTADTETVISLLKELYLELGDERDSVETLDNNLIVSLIRNERTEIFLALNSENIVCGIMTLTHTQSIYAGGAYGVIDELYIRPDFRSMKVGTALVGKAIETAKTNNWKRIDVTAPSGQEWKSTVKFYERCGFKFTGPKLKFIVGG